MVVERWRNEFEFWRDGRKHTHAHTHTHTAAAAAAAAPLAHATPPTTYTMPRDPHRQSPALANSMKTIEKKPRSSRGARGGRSVQVKIPSWSTVDRDTLLKGIGHPDYLALS